MSSRSTLADDCYGVKMLDTQSSGGSSVSHTNGGYLNNDGYTLIFSTNVSPATNAFFHRIIQFFDQQVCFTFHSSLNEYGTGRLCPEWYQ